MGKVGGHQHRVPGWKGAGLAVAHAGVDQVGSLAGSPAVTADGHVEGCRRREDGGMNEGGGDQVQYVFHYISIIYLRLS